MKGILDTHHFEHYNTSPVQHYLSYQLRIKTYTNTSNRNQLDTLKDGMQHVGKLMCSKLGAKIDFEPKRWRTFAYMLYDFGSGLEVLSPLCPPLFLEMAGLGNFAKGMAMVVGCKGNKIDNLFFICKREES
ncbi:protein root UVB sensitive 2, chloroplastic-like [Lactuca sativa]|uniref:protein root UVB sensitive 2, chloroplastic-like n=1 Tax=Lactuca sativa TaxID=4236 RepID=UPI001C68C5D8|nr:protein root UVB sensitive 2, chloroplastic-like [Lactuca sativa]XP_042758264.1 protein root UVB sensitive 2, chloroplastic-like [Lactuca sativa]